LGLVWGLGVLARCLSAWFVAVVGTSLTVSPVLPGMIVASPGFLLGVGSEPLVGDVSPVLGAPGVPLPGVPCWVGRGFGEPGGRAVMAGLSDFSGTIVLPGVMQA